MVIKIKKTKKSKKLRGTTTYGHGARKKKKGKGHKGGKGMAGTGKRGDQKKTLITKLYGNKYFGKKGITSKKTKKKKNKIINLEDIEKKFEEKEINLMEYKVLGKGEIKGAVTVIAKAFTPSAKKKIETAGGKAVLSITQKNSQKNSDKIKNGV